MYSTRSVSFSNSFTNSWIKLNFEIIWLKKELYETWVLLRFTDWKRKPWPHSKRNPTHKNIYYLKYLILFAISPMLQRFFKMIFQTEVEKSREFKIWFMNFCSKLFENKLDSVDQSTLFEQSWPKFDQI